MRSPFLTAAAVCALGVAAACSSSGTPSGASTPASSGSSASAPVGSSGGYAFPTRDAPYESILAEASRTGRPALLFFWTSW